MAPTLLEHLKKLYPQAKHRTLKRMVEEGRVEVNGAPAKKLKLELASADKVSVLQRATSNPGDVRPLRIVHEDRDLLVVYKPHGILTSTTPGERRQTAVELLRRYLLKTDRESRIGVIHRLDREAAGLLVFSKNPASYRSLKNQFFEHTVERQYHAVVAGAPAERQGRIESEISEGVDGRVRSTRGKRHDTIAITEYEVVDSGAGCSLLKIKLETGKKHQIRVQLAELGHPILNDRRYGAVNIDQESSPPTGHLMLVATRLAFHHPRGGKLARFELPVPPVLKQLVKKGAPESSRKPPLHRRKPRKRRER